MPRALIIYGSNSSNTYSASCLIAEELKSAGFSVTMLSAGEATAQDVAAHDFVLLGSCTWSKPTPDGHELQGQLQELFERFAETLRHEKFPGKRFAVFASGDSRYTKFCAAADLLERLVGDVGGKQVGQSLRIDGLTCRHDEGIRAWAHGVAKAYAAA